MEKRFVPFMNDRSPFCLVTSRPEAEGDPLMVER